MFCENHRIANIDVELHRVVTVDTAVTLPPRASGHVASPWLTVCSVAS